MVDLFIEENEVGAAPLSELISRRKAIRARLNFHVPKRPIPPVPIPVFLVYVPIVPTPPRDTRWYRRHMRVEYRDGVMAMVRELGVPEPGRGATVAEIQQLAAKGFGITQDEMLSRCIEARVVRPRFVAMYLTRSMMAVSFSWIGRVFGGKDHATVMYAVRKIEALRQTDLAIDAYFNLLSKRLI